MDLLHEGHVNLLSAMNQRGDLTLVILHDGFSTFPNKHRLPIESLEKRTRNLIDSGMVDIVRHTFSPEPTKEFSEVSMRYGDKFELVFMRGDDWSEFPGRPTIERLGVPIELVPYTQSISSSKLRNEL